MTLTPQIIFHVGPGILFCVPLTQTDHLLDGIFMLKLNTCQTYSVIDSVRFGEYNQKINEIMQIFNGNQQIINLLNDLKEIMNNLFIFIKRNSILQTIQATSEDSKCFVMNFVGRDDYDQYDININEEIQLINLFLKETKKSPPYKSRRLPVLIDNGGNPEEDRDMSIKECLITSSLISFFQNNNFPFKSTDDNNIDYFIFQNEDINKIDNNDKSKIFSIIHYIQSLFTSIMILYIDESPQTREIIFDNILNLINECEIESTWLNEKQNNEAVSFLIEKILFNANLIQSIDFDSIKKLSIDIYQMLEDADHVTQIEFIKLPKNEKIIANGFMIKTGYFYLPLSNLLTALHKEIDLDLENPIFSFLSTIEKHCSQLLTKNLILENYMNKISTEDWINSLKDFNNMNSKERTKFILQYDQEIQDLLLGISATNFNEINNLSNQSFQYVLPNNLSKFNEDEQIQLFFINKNNRFRFISSKQIKIIKSQTFSLLSNAVKHNKISPKNFNEFIQINGIYISIEQLLPIEFDILDIQSQTIFLLKIINGSPNQIQQINLMKCQSEILEILIEKRMDDLSKFQRKNINFEKLNRKVVRKFVDKKLDEIEENQFKTINFLYFSDDERISLLEKKFKLVTADQFLTLNFQKLKEKNKNLYDDAKQYLFEHSTNHKSMIFYLYLFHSQKFEINEYVIPKMAEGFKVVYLNNHANSIKKEYQQLFYDSVKIIFETCNFYRDELFSIIINQWDHELIRNLINFIDLNEFPKKLLYELIYLYPNDLRLEKLVDFKINDINQIYDMEKRFFVFQYFINCFTSNNRFDLIKKIKTGNSNKQEIEFLLKKALKHLTPDQIIQIDLTQITRILIIELINEKALSLLQNQIQSLDANDSEFMRLIIQYGRSNYLDKNQIKSINFEQLNSDDVIKKLINTKIEKIFVFEYLKEDQIKFIKYNLLIGGNAQKEFLKSKGKFLSKEQIQQIIFKKGQKNIDFNVQLLCYLDKYNKLLFLDETQAQNLVDIFESKNFDKLLNIFKSPAFASFCTNKQATQINNNIIQALNLNALEPHFLKYLIKFKINIFLPEQIRQYDFSGINKNLLNVWFEKLSEYCSPEVNKDEWEQLIIEKVINLPIEKLREIEIPNLNIEILKILLNKRIDDLENSQIEVIDTSNPEIATILINKKFNSLKNEQKFNIPLSKLKHEDQASFITQLTKHDAFLLNYMNKKEIHKINLNELINYPEGYFYLLIYDKLSKKQYMTINWMVNDEYDRLNIALIYFLQHKLEIKKDENYQYLKRILTSHLENEKIDEKIFEKSPVHYKVSFLNTKVLNSELIDENLHKYFIPDAIKIMFESAKYYLVTVQFIINRWIHLSQDISKFIDVLTIHSEFSEETINNLLSLKYLFQLKPIQIQQINISNIQSPIIEYALKNRACDFSVEQIQNSNCIDKEIICDQLKNLQKCKKIPSLNLVGLHIILISFLFNQKFDHLKYEKIDELLINRVNELDKNHLNKINLTQIKSESLNHVFHERMNDISENQFNQLNSNVLNKLNIDNLLNLLTKYSNKLTKKLVEDLDVSNSRVAAFFLINCEKLLEEKHIQSMNLIEVSSITQNITGKSSFDIVKGKNMLSKLSNDQLNQLDFSDINNVKLVLEHKLENKINKENCEQINMDDVNNLNDDLKINLIQSRIRFFTEFQMQKLDVNNVGIAIPIIENNRSSQLTINQIQQIKVKDLEAKHLSKLITAKLYDFTNAQMNEINVKNILKNQENNDVLITLGNEPKITQFKSYHIDSIRITSIEVMSLLIIYHCKNLSNSQIKCIDTDNWNDLDNNIKKISTNSAIYYFIDAKKFRDFDDNQFNALIDFTNLSCIKEIICENLENKIIQKNAIKINLFDSYHYLSKPEFLRLFESCYLMFTKEQIQSLNLSFLETKFNLLQSLIINRLSYLSQKQMKETYVSTIIKSLSPNNILQMLNDEHNKSFVTCYHICDIDIKLSDEVTKTIVGYYPNMLTEQNIKSLNLDLNITISDIHGKNKTILDILISNNKLIYFNDEQLNMYIDYSNAKYVIEVLKHESLFDKILSENVEKIKTNDVCSQLTDTSNLFSLLNMKIKDFSDQRINRFNSAKRSMAKIFRENNIICRLTEKNKSTFNINELELCNFDNLINFIIPGKGEIYNVAIGIMLYRFFNGEYRDIHGNMIKSWLKQCEKGKKYNEIYLAHCIKLAEQKLKSISFVKISSIFFNFFDDLSREINFSIMKYMTFGSFTDECIQFNIIPADLRYIMKIRYRSVKDKSLFKKELSNIISSSKIFSNMGSEYRNDLKILYQELRI